MAYNDYCILGKLPVKRERTSDGRKKALKLDWKTLAFVWGYDVETRIDQDRSGDVEYVTKDEFIQYVETLRARDYQGDDKLSELYRVTNWIEDHAKDENRSLTAEEKSILIMIRCRTYDLFQEMYPEP